MSYIAVINCFSEMTSYSFKGNTFPVIYNVYWQTSQGRYRCTYHMKLTCSLPHHTQYVVLGTELTVGTYWWTCHMKWTCNLPPTLNMMCDSWLTGGTYWCTLHMKWTLQSTSPLTMLHMGHFILLIWQSL